MDNFEKLQKQIKTSNFLLRQMKEKLDAIANLDMNEINGINISKEAKEKYISQLFPDYNAWREIFITQGNLTI